MGKSELRPDSRLGNLAPKDGKRQIISRLDLSGIQTQGLRLHSDCPSKGQNRRKSSKDMDTTLHSPEPGKEHRWYVLLRTQEGAIFLAGLGCLALILTWFAWIMKTEPGKAGVMLAVFTAHLTGGRASGIAVATNSHLFSRLETIFLGTLIEGTIVGLFFSIFCMSLKRAIRVPLLNSAIQNVHRSAESQRGRLLKWGIPGLILFVWFPFLMTGPVVGSVIGFLLGMRPWVVLCVVMFGTISAIISWTFILDQLAAWASRVGDMIPLLVVFLIIAFIAAYRARKFITSQSRARNGTNGKDRSV